MAKRFTPEEWTTIDTRLRGREAEYGIPGRSAGSLVLASWNIRKFGAKPKAGAASGRSPGAYELIARFAANCDLIAIQECQSDLEFGALARRRTGPPRPRGQMEPDLQ